MERVEAPRAFVDEKVELFRAAEASLSALGIDAIGLYQFHRPDPEVDYADSVGAIRDLLDEGKIGILLRSGLSAALGCGLLLAFLRKQEGNHETHETHEKKTKKRQ